MMEIVVTWMDAGLKNEAELKNKVIDCFKMRNLECTHTNNGLVVTCNKGDKSFAYMWLGLMDLVEYKWFYEVVKSCVWKDEDEMEDVIESGKELVDKGDIVLHE